MIVAITFNIQIKKLKNETAKILDYCYPDRYCFATSNLLYKRQRITEAKERSQEK